MQATWHRGHSLSQTVFSCIYLLRPGRTSSHALLHSFCRVIRATCKAVISVVSDARTHEVKYSNSSFWSILSQWLVEIFDCTWSKIQSFILFFYYRSSWGTLLHSNQFIKWFSCAALVLHAEPGPDVYCVPFQFQREIPLLASHNGQLFMCNCIYIKWSSG